MKITVNGYGVIDVDVRHDQTPFSVDRFSYRGKTTCEINFANPHGTRSEVITPLAQSEAFCSMEDNFSRHVGASVAVARALQKMPFNRTQRREFWNRFWNGKYSNEQVAIKRVA